MGRPVKVLLPLLLLMALAVAAAPQVQKDTDSTPNPLVSLLASKGIISQQEAAMLAGAVSPDEVQQRLARLLVAKGVITVEEYARSFPSPPPQHGQNRRVPGTPSAEANAIAAAIPPASLRVVAAVLTSAPAGSSATPAQAPRPAEAPKVVPAVTPLRVLPITLPKKGGLLPDLKLGSGASLRPYGFFKISEVHQTASHGGATFGSNDFPQGPLLLGDTGPDADPQFHIKARAFRAGVDFEWPDLAQNLTLTGKLEFDFEGNFTNVNNRNISANRSSQPSLRLAWVRLDTKLGELPWFVQFGQDWSIFGSSTLMDLFETTGFGFAQGNLYERMPMFRTGVQFGKGDLKFQPEFAIALASFGEPALDVDQRTRFGGRVGPEGGQPEIQARTVFQYPLSRAPGVVPAQLIFSFDHARRRELVPFGNLPAAVQGAFPHGLELTSVRNAWSAEIQVPTAWVTVVGKYYRGGDLRYYFMGQFNDVFTDLQGAAPLTTLLGAPVTATTFAGRVIPFGRDGAGNIVAARLEPALGQGGFLQLGFPISRIFGAVPETRAAGWTMYLTYGVDSAFGKDAIRANGLLRTDHASFQLRYKLNKWVTFAQETTYLDTRTAGSIRKPFRGMSAHTAHAWRNEFGPIFTF